MNVAKKITRQSFADSVRALYLKDKVRIELDIDRQVWGIGKVGLREIILFMSQHGVVSEYLYENSFIVRGSEISIIGSLSDKPGAEICITIDVIYSGSDAHLFKYSQLQSRD